MLEWIVVILVVAWAGWMVFKIIGRELRGKGCSNCSCNKQFEKTTRMIQIQSPDKREPI